DRRHHTHRPERGTLRRAGGRSRDRAAQGRTNATDAREPDAVAGALPRDGRPARHRGSDGDGAEIPRRGGEYPAPQPLTGTARRLRIGSATIRVGWGEGPQEAPVRTRNRRAGEQGGIWPRPITGSSPR